MRSLSVTVSILLCTISLFAQNEFAGVIIDQTTEEPIPNVNVYLYKRGLPQVLTDGHGRFEFKHQTLKLDIFAKYAMAIYKPGYKRIERDVTFPLLQAIKLEKSPSGYVQLFDRSGDFLEGIEISHQGAPPVKTDRFGYFEVVMPAQVAPGKPYRISIKGGKTYRDTFITFTARDLIENVSIYLTQRKLSYEQLTGAFELQLGRFATSYMNENDELQADHLDSLMSLYERIRTMKLKRPADQKYRNLRLKLMKKTLNELNELTIFEEDIEAIERSHEIASIEFTKQYDKLYSKPLTWSRVVERFERLLQAGICGVELFFRTMEDPSMGP